jgi:hypothetical protein
MIAGKYAYVDDQGVRRPTPAEISKWERERDELSYWRILYGTVTSREMGPLLAILYLGLPMSIYLTLIGAGWAAAWVYRGFRGDPRGPKGK